MMHDTVWMDRLNYIEAEEHIHLTKTPQPQPQAVSSSLVSEISSMRENIKTCVSGISNLTTTDTTTSDGNVQKLEAENKSLKKLIDDLSRQVNNLTLRVGKLEGSTPVAAPVAAPPAPSKKADDDDDDDDDFDMFGSDEDEEETEEEKRIKEERVAAYTAKKQKKPALIAKSSITLDVKPWDDETDMVEVERLVRTIQMDGMVWGASKLVPVGYGIKKLQIICVVEDEKCGSDILDEKISEFTDYVQSVDVAAFNKI